VAADNQRVCVILGDRVSASRLEGVAFLSMTQRVLVTAGATGIGREIVRAFAAQGAKVFVCDIDGPGLDSLAKEIPGDQGLRHIRNVRTLKAWSHSGSMP
jgi:NADP-dependent 3-hydroxy acid dehydrogenase YdfG